MASLGLGFRPPQFSEDVAWLPAWLQPHQFKSSIERENEARITSTQEYQNLVTLRGRASEGKEVDLLSREEGKYTSFHLFLSGEEDLPTNFTSSPANGFHFHLHLSSDGDTQNNKSQLLFTSQSKKDTDKFLSVQEIKTSTDDEEKGYQSKPHSYTCGENKSYDKKSIDNSSAQSLIDNKERQCEETRHIKDTDVNDAVELSVAASEALVIHELVSVSESLPAAAVLEAALSVKQARLEGVKGSFCCPTEETEDIDFLSDLDDCAMADSFEDVGLSFSGSGSHDLDISQVQDTPVSDDIHGCENGFKRIDLPSQEKKGLNTAHLASQVNLMLNQPSQEVLDASAVGQKVGIVARFDGNTSQAQKLQNAEREGEASYLVANKLRSRWFSGWTVKEVDASAMLQNNNTKSVLNYFIGETSFLSESADVAPDENSFAHKSEARCKIASQSSVPFGGFCGKDNEEILVSQDIVRSSNQSLVDPLCSVVPCSISFEIGNYPQNQNDREGATGNCLGPSLTECILRTSDLDIESALKERQAEPKIGGECCLAPTRRQLMSLKTYSTLSAKRDTILDRGNSVPNISLPPEQNMYGITSYNKRNSKAFSPFVSSDEANGKDSEQHQIRNLVEETAGDSILTCKPVENGAFLQVKPSKKCRAPLILNQRMRQRLRASNLWVSNSSGKKNPDYAIAQETTSEHYTIAQETSSELHQSKNLEKIQSECNKLDVAQVQARKRVRFSETETELEPSRAVEQLPSSRINCSTFAACKRLKYSNVRSDTQTQNDKMCFTNCVKDAKKLIFLGIEFLLTGFSCKKEKDIELQIRKYGGMVLMDIPPPPNSRGKKSSRSYLQQLPIVLSPKKLQTSKFLYGCAVNAFILKVKWLTDSIAAGSIAEPTKYMILAGQSDVNLTKFGKSVHSDNRKCIFHKVGIMLHGKPSFCTKLATIVKHGGGQVFKSLHWLAQSVETKRIAVGAIVAEDDIRASRHLRHCALERKIPMMPACWIINSLHLGRLLPQPENKHAPLLTIKVPESPNSLEWSQEI